MVEDWMVSAAMAIQGQSRGTGSHSTSPAGNGGSISSGLHSVTGIQLMEQFNSGNDYAPKVRKPYTITKHRERWTEEEHKKFLDALKLYGRAWRKIEEHVGTKTAVQIRSHAQKFFSKVNRESNVGNSVEPVEIPPPRPKRKPVHPYPRKDVQPPSWKTLKLESPMRSSSANSAICDHENQSPSSVLSAFGSETLGSTDSDTQNGSLSPTSTFTVNKSCLVLNDPKTVLEEGFLECTQFPITSKPPVMHSALFPGNNVNPIEETAGTILRLFGRTVLVTDDHKPFFPITTNSRLSSPEMHDQENTQSSSLNFSQVESSADNAQRCRNGMRKGPNYTANHVQHQSVDSNLEEARAAAFVLCSFMPNQKQLLEEEHEKQLETSFSSTALVNSRRKSESSERESHPLSCCKGFDTKVSDCSVISEVRTKCERSRGFVPYERIVAKRDGFCSMMKIEREDQPIHLSL